MKAPKHKFTSQVQLEIINLAKTLPRMAKFKADGTPEYKARAVDYDYCIKYGVKVNGKDPLPGYTYQVQELQYVNHAMVMNSIFREDGMEGVNTYIKEVHQRYKDRIKDFNEHKKYNNRIDRRIVNFFKKIGNKFTTKK